MKQHYTSIQQDMLIQLKLVDPEKGERALEVAARWARRNLKNILSGTINVASEEIRQLWGRVGVYIRPQKPPLMVPQRVVLQKGQKTDEGVRKQFQGGSGSIIILMFLNAQILFRQGTQESRMIDLTGESEEEEGDWLTLDEVTGNNTSQGTQEDVVGKRKRREGDVGGEPRQEELREGNKEDCDG